MKFASPSDSLVYDRTVARAVLLLLLLPLLWRAGIARFAEYRGSGEDARLGSDHHDRDRGPGLVRECTLLPCPKECPSPARNAETRRRDDRRLCSRASSSPADREFLLARARSRRACRWFPAEFFKSAHRTKSEVTAKPSVPWRVCTGLYTLSAAAAAVKGQQAALSAVDLPLAKEHSLRPECPTTDEIRGEEPQLVFSPGTLSSPRRSIAPTWRAESYRCALSLLLLHSKSRNDNGSPSVQLLAFVGKLGPPGVHPLFYSYMHVGCASYFTATFLPPSPSFRPSFLLLTSARAHLKLYLSRLTQ